MAIPAIVTIWGGPQNPAPTGKNSVHRGIVSPSQSEGDLALTSSVSVQSFFSLHQHQYNYVPDNRLAATMRVKWAAAEIEWPGVGPGQFQSITIHSYFSPKEVEGTADVDVFAHPSLPQTRQVRGEVANAYRPWFKPGKMLADLVTGLANAGKILTVGATIKNSAGAALAISSAVKNVGGAFAYTLKFNNGFDHPVRLQMSRGFSGREALAVDLAGKGTKEFDQQFIVAPGEFSASATCVSTEPAGEGSVKFPIQLLMPDDSGYDDLLKTKKMGRELESPFEIGRGRQVERPVSDPIKHVIQRGAHR